jgi:DNA-binding GntR family transcriptional regulator
LVTSLNPVERPLALGDQVYLALRANLRNGKILPGYPLQEVQLAAQLGVSRTPVREALTRLASEGLVCSDGRSFAVPELNLQNVDDIYEVRFLLEPEAVRHVAEQASAPATLAPVLQALEANIAAHKAADHARFIDANALFRSAWLVLVPNRRLVHAVELYADHVQHLRALTLDDAKVRNVVLRGLKRIAAALAAADGDAAALAMREHLTEAKRAFIAAVGLARNKEIDTTAAEGKAQ